MKLAYCTLALGVAFATEDVRSAPAHGLTIGEGFTNPLGFHDPTPAFSWKLPEGVKKQSAYRIETRSGDTTWDSGWVESDQSTFVPYGGEPFASRDRVAWRVDFKDESGKAAGWSETATFELGLLSNEDWTAKWIHPTQPKDPVKERVGVLRRSFPVAKPVNQARLYVTARGVFDVGLNGKRIGRDHFANGFTAYQKRIDTLSYDITASLRSGQNAIDARIGAGWFAGRFPFNAKARGPYGKDFSLLAQIEITYQDGSMETVVSDEKWEGSFGGPIVTSSLYDGEEYDARRQPADWQPVTATKVPDWCRLEPKPFQPVRETETLTVKAITEPEPGRFVFDLEQNMVGWARVKIPVEKDKTVTLRFAEMLKDDGTLYTENYRSAKSIDTYTAAETGTIEWEPTFTFHGFRYVELSGLPAGAKPEKDWVVGVVLHTDFPVTGTFSSSHEKLNQLQSNITWGWRDNALDIPTDCPQRDERLGWTGDAQAFCATAMFNTGSHAFWKSWLGSMRDDQDKDGVIPDVIPAAGTRFRQRSAGWMDAATIVPWDVYVRTGDKEVLSENLAMMEKLVGWYRAQAPDGVMPDGIRGYGDWLQPHTQRKKTAQDKMGDRRGDTPIPLIATAFHAHSARILADSARVLGRDEEAKRHGEHAASVRAAFVKEYFDAGGKLKPSPETQTGYVLALAFDLLPENLRPMAGGHLARLVREAGTHLRTGFLGTPYLTRVLDDTGHADLAAELLFQESYPSWFYSIHQGATTMWERWNSYTKDKGFGDVSMNSFNHYAYGAIGQWMYERVAGLAPDPAHPGYKHFYIRPLFVKQLDSARAELETPYGKAVSSWKRDGGKVTLKIVVPPNTTATIKLPGAPQKDLPAGPGRHRIEVNDGAIHAR